MRQTGPGFDGWPVYSISEQDRIAERIDKNAIRVVLHFDRAEIAWSVRVGDAGQVLVVRCAANVDIVAGDRRSKIQAERSCRHAPGKSNQQTSQCK